MAAAGKTKKLLVVLDGVGDRPAPKLKGKTPLEAARPRALNALARSGRTGLAKIAGRIAPESDVGVFSVLGFNPFARRVGRGALEALGAGLRLHGNWIALRVNFATAGKGLQLVDRRVGRSLSSLEAKKLEEEVNARVQLHDAGFEFKATVAHRGVLVIRARRALSPAVSNTDPAYARTALGIVEAKQKFAPRILECVSLSNSPAAKRSARLVNEFAEQARSVLEASEVNKQRSARGLLPANCLLLRDAETRVKKLRKMRDWSILADMPLEIGIGRALGMRVLALPTPSGALKKSEYAVRVKKTLAALSARDCDGVYVHIKGPDVFGHYGDALGKTRCVKEIDEFFFKPLLKKIDLRRTRILVTADHATPCVLRAHSADPVPVLLAGAGIKSDGSKEFNEKKGAKGSIRVNGFELMTLLSS